MSMPERGGPAVLRIADARCSVGGHRIFSGLSLDVRVGERVHLGGPNGSGKTTVLRCVGGTMCIDRGWIQIDGAPAGSARARALTGLCIDPERGLYPKLSGHDNLLLAARLRLPGRQVGTAVDLVERELAITPFAARAVHDYSAGMRARVTVARALLGRPAVLLLDEPTRSLDADGRELLWAALDRRPGVACVIASHLLGDRDRCDRSVDLSGQPR